MAQEYNAIDVPYNHLVQGETLGSRLPYYLAYQDLQAWKAGPLVRKLLGKPVKWSSNEGSKVLRNEYFTPSPIRRQIPLPNDVWTDPNVDLIGHRRFSLECTPRWQDMHSDLFDWSNTFIEKFPTKVEDIRKDMQDKNVLFEEQFLMGQLWHMCPRVFVAGNGWVDVAPDATGATKNAAWVQGKLVPAKEGSITELMSIGIEMRNNRGVGYFEGKDYDENMKSGGTFALLCSDEFRLAATFDPYVQAARPLNMNLIGDTWREAPFGMYTWRNLRYPIRYAEAGTLPEPEMTEANANAYNKGQTVSNPLYTGLIEAPLEVAIILGKNSGAPLDMGPPPAFFSGPKVSGAILGMSWNGKVEVNKNILVEKFNQDGTVSQAINPGGRKARFESTLTMGFVPKELRAIGAYVYRRRIGPPTV